MAERRRTKTPKPRPPTRNERPPVDKFKRFHIAIALAPTYASAYLGGKVGIDHDDLAEALVDLADAIARRLAKD